MSILTRIIDKLKQIVGRVEERVDEIKDNLQQRRRESLAAELDKLASDKPYKNWRVSSEDLAFLLDEDGSYPGRKALWSELGLGGDYRGSAMQNMRLHLALLDRASIDGIPWPHE